LSAAKTAHYISGIHDIMRQSTKSFSQNVRYLTLVSAMI